jgi:hypothetical protein
MVVTPMERLHAMLLVVWAEYGSMDPTSLLMPESGGMGRLQSHCYQPCRLDKPNGLLRRRLLAEISEEEDGACTCGSWWCRL